MTTGHGGRGKSTDERARSGVSSGLIWRGWPGKRMGNARRVAMRPAFFNQSSTCGLLRIAPQHWRRAHLPPPPFPIVPALLYHSVVLAANV